MATSDILPSEQNAPEKAVPETEKPAAEKSAATPENKPKPPALPKKNGPAAPAKSARTEKKSPPPPQTEYVPRQHGWKQVMVVYGASTVLHGILALVAALYVLPENTVKEIFSTIVSATDDKPEPPMEDPVVDDEALAISDESEETEDSAAAEVVNDTPSPIDLDFNDLEPSIDPDIVTTGAGPAVKVSEAFSGRTEASRGKTRDSNGGSAATDLAVMTGLEWLAKIQQKDGSWSFKEIGGSKNPGTLENRMSATGMAMLAFLGYGATHERTKFAPNVEKGLMYMLKNMKVTAEGGDLRGDVKSNEGMYTQGICSIVLCELYGMTPPDGKRRRDLKKAAELAVSFIIRAQDPKGGGWRYTPRQAGDTSVVGWQLMALKSAKASNINIPSRILDGTTHFLDSVSADGSTYGYVGPEDKVSTTAIGLLCRMYLGWKQDNPSLIKGVDFLAKTGPSRGDMYYNYYGTYVMHLWGGEKWKKWNDTMREQLIRNQQQKGEESGSWNPSGGHGAGPGGRLYETVMSVMTLEVYYRQLPIYQRKNSIGDEF